MSEKEFHQFMNKEHNYYSEDLMITRYGRYINDEVESLWIAWKASRAQAIDECLQLHESIKVTPLHESIKITPPDNDDWIDAIIDSREAYQSALKQLKEQP